MGRPDGGADEPHDEVSAFRSMVATVLSMSDNAPDQPISDELKVDIDQDKLAKWDEVSDQYAGEGEQDKRRPVFTDDNAPARSNHDGSAGSGGSDDGRGTDGASDDQAGDASGLGVQDDQERPDEDQPDQAASDA